MASTKRSYTLTFSSDGTDYTFTGPKASGLIQQLERYKNTGLPKLLEIVDEDTMAKDWFDPKCVCHFNAIPSSEEVDPRECRQIDCLPDDPGSSNPPTVDV